MCLPLVCVFWVEDVCVYVRELCVDVHASVGRFFSASGEQPAVVCRTNYERPHQKAIGKNVV